MALDAVEHESILSDALRRCRTLLECGDVFGRWVEASILARGSLLTQDHRVARAALTIGSSEPKRFDVEQLARLECVTRRQLERDFRRRLGMSPGAYARVVRFQRAAAAVAGTDPLNPRPTRAFAEYSQARGFLLDPARVRRPKDKACAPNCSSYVGWNAKA